MNEFPRRIQLDKFVSAEKAIFDAIQEIEKLPPSPILTDAIVLLSKSKDLVSDYVDNEYINSIKNE